MNTTTRYTLSTMIAAASVFAMMALAPRAEAANLTYSPPPANNPVKTLSVVVTPNKPTTSTVPTTPTVTPTNPTPPPVVVVTTTTTVSTPTPPRMPDRPGMFTNLPSDMRSMSGLGQVTSINSLLTTPGAIELSLPRQAVPNMLENRQAATSTANAAAAKSDALQALENAKPLI